MQFGNGVLSYFSCIFGTKRFHDYLFGRHFELITDHKPLLGLLKEDRATSTQASPRIKRWSLFLLSYEYSLVFRSTTAHSNANALSWLPHTPRTTAHSNANALSWLPLPQEPGMAIQEPELVLLAEHLTSSPVTADDIRGWTRKDKTSRVLQYIQQGWPNEEGKDMEPYSSRQLELSTFEGCILWESRVVVPPPGREAVLRELHEGHPGMT